MLLLYFEWLARLLYDVIFVYYVVSKVMSIFLSLPLLGELYGFNAGGVPHDTRPSWPLIMIWFGIIHHHLRVNLNSSCSRNLKHFGNPKKWKFAQKSQILWRKWISGRNVQKSADYWDTHFFLFSQKFHDQSFLPNCEIIEPGTTFLEISLDSAYSIDFKNGLTFENR